MAVSASCAMRRRNDGLESTRVFGQYRGRIANTLSATVIADYESDASSGIDVTEAYMDRRPIPKSENQQRTRWRVLPPVFARERRPRLAEPVHVFVFGHQHVARRGSAADRRRMVAASPTRLRRLTARAARVRLGLLRQRPRGHAALLARLVVCTTAEAARRHVADAAAPDLRFHGLRGRSRGSNPSILSTRSITGPAPMRASSGAMRTVCSSSSRATTTVPTRMPTPAASGVGARRSITLGLQAGLPWDLGLVAQWLQGETLWVQGARADGTLSPFASLVRDDFDAKFLMLTRLVRGAHRVSLRYDAFDMHRTEGARRGLQSDDGHAWTLAYRYEHSARWSGGIEWLQIDSARDNWAFFYASYGAPKQATETEIRLQMTFRVGATPR